MKKVTIAFPNGDMFEFPLRIIANDYARYYAEKSSHLYDQVYQEEFDYIMNNPSEAINWLHGNMDWEDVKEYAVQVQGNTPPNYRKWFSNTDVNFVE